MYDLIIIGSGPAGLSAAVYAKRSGLELLVVEGNAMSGGQVLNTYEVDNYLGLPGIDGFEMGQTFRKHADKLGVTFKNAQVTAGGALTDEFSPYTMQSKFVNGLYCCGEILDIHGDCGG